jgi:hypothetical protein
MVDLRALASLRGAGTAGPGRAGSGAGRRLAGVIVGKAIYEGRVDLDGALRTLRALGVGR